MQFTLRPLASGVTIATYQAGDPTGQPVLFLHGNSLAASTFQHQFDAPELQHLHLVALDWPGCGASPDAPACYHPRQFQEVLCEAIGALGIQSALLVGHSYGGHLGLHALPAVPSLRGLLAVGTPPVNVPDDVAAAFALDERGQSFYQAAVSNEQRADLVALCLGPGASAEVQQVVDSALRRADGRLRAAIGSALAAGEIPDETAIARATRVPLAFAAGEADPLLHFRYFEQVAAPARWGAPLHVVPGAGHTPFLENPAAFNALLLDFLASVVGPRPAGVSIGR
ncbi:alpha/beta hydrolase [Hymenobacter sp. BT523]|uniref:alpha/beta fold hydrolase n=1 Tax=Hymenobacter sp. BT523 TaxID=2795725 RepID=UPI0018EB837C|nr:alpha/beta hydrolase [Hymenobacter sp. BT523]MBJ6107846.1 alpha/beta hydrolase [Hymenobacter sp. BT523]